MSISQEEIRNNIKVTNLLRLGKRLNKGNADASLFKTFESSYADTKHLLTASQTRAMEDLYIKLRSSYSGKNESEALFGKRDEEDFDYSQAEIEKQILELARNMKQVANNFSSTLQKDNVLLESIQSRQNQYISQLKTEQDRMDSIQVKTNFFAFFKTLISLIFSLVVFVFMLFIIYMFPSTTYITLPR